ncbi:MAG: hypothetical protein H7Y03_04170, partial [Chitinophagaceae bacterium]|nr:hypothetical protein [Chitinophagaceae bacterium]
MMKGILVLAFLVHATGNVSASFYFSDSKGNDSHTPSQATSPSTPWKSLDKLNSIKHLIAAGDTVYFLCGDVFRGRIVFNKSGTTGKPIVFTSYGSGAKPVISGLRLLKDWKRDSDGNWYTTDRSLGSTVNLLLIDGTLQQLGRYPNSNTGSGYLIYEQAAGNTSITDD